MIKNERSKQLMPWRVEVNTRMPVLVAELLTEASDKTGQTKTHIVIDAIRWYCGKPVKGNQDLALRRTAILAAVGGALDENMQTTVKKLNALAKQLGQAGF